MRNLVLFILLTLFSDVALAQDVHHMKLSHHDFEPWNFIPKPGDRIEIENFADIVHAVYVTYPDGTIVNLTENGVNLPGSKVSWTIPDNASDGDGYVLSCWIHTIIRAELKIDKSNN